MKILLFAAVVMLAGSAYGQSGQEPVSPPPGNPIGASPKPASPGTSGASTTQSQPIPKIGRAQPSAQPSPKNALQTNAAKPKSAPETAQPAKKVATGKPPVTKIISVTKNVILL